MSLKQINECLARDSKSKEKKRTLQLKKILLFGVPLEYQAYVQHHKATYRLDPSLQELTLLPGETLSDFSNAQSADVEQQIMEQEMHPFV